MGYLCIVVLQDNVRCLLLMSRSYMTPKNEITIFQLELPASAVAVKVDQVIRKQLNLAQRPSVFFGWTLQLFCTVSYMTLV